MNQYRAQPPSRSPRCRHLFFFFSSRRRHTRFDCDWSSDVCSSDLAGNESSRPDIGVNVGSGTFIPGFEDQLVGMAAGEKRLVKVTFPANYTSAELARSEERRVGKEWRSRWAPDH